MSKNVGYKPQDYALALSDVATWLHKNASRIIGDDVRDVHRQDITISIEPCCMITVNVDTEYIVFKNGKQVNVEHHEEDTI